MAGPAICLSKEETSKGQRKEATPTCKDRQPACNSGVALRSAFI